MNKNITIKEGKGKTYLWRDSTNPAWSQLRSVKPFYIYDGDKPIIGLFVKMNKTTTMRPINP